MSEPMEAAEHPWYHARVLELESEGCTTSDAQGVADAEYANELRGLRQANKTLRAQRDRLREACEAACRAAADCLPPSGEGPLDALYYKAKLQAIDEAAAKCSTALKECGE